MGIILHFDLKFWIAVRPPSLIIIFPTEVKILEQSEHTLDFSFIIIALYKVLARLRSSLLPWDIFLLFYVFLEIKRLFLFDLILLETLIIPTFLDDCDRPTHIVLLWDMQVTFTSGSLVLLNFDWKTTYPLVAVLHGVCKALIPLYLAAIHLNIIHLRSS
jgi:hypothetical protein